MTQQNLFQTEPRPAGKHRDLLRKRTRPADFREKVAAVLACYRPAEGRSVGRTPPKGHSTLAGFHLQTGRASSFLLAQFFRFLIRGRNGQ
jgi:hypothetical protein